MAPSPEPSERAAALYDDDAFEGPLCTSDRLFDAEGPMAPSISPSGECDPSVMVISGSPDRESETGPCVGEVPSLYATPAAPPDIVVEAFLPVELASVVEPQPR